MDTSSESDSYDRTRGHRPRGREAHRKPDRDRARVSGSGGDDRPADITEKISTLANTLQVLCCSLLYKGEVCAQKGRVDSQVKLNDC